MPKFNASDVEKIEYDFTEWGGSKGEINEPPASVVKDSMKKIGKATEELSNIQQEQNLLNPNAEDYQEKYQALMQKIENLSDELFENIDEETVTATAMLCNGTPSYDEIVSLPYRVQELFCQYILKEFTNPEGSTAGTQDQSKTE